MVVTTPSTIMPPPTCDNYKTKNAFLGIFDPTMTLTLDLLTPKFDAFILAPKSVSGESLVKFRQQILPKISC